MNPWNASNLLKQLGIVTAIVAVAAFACLWVGSTGVHWPNSSIIRFRLEPVLVSALIGAALAAAGVAYQAILRNPLADPYLLGVSSGASLAAYVWRLPIFTTIFGAVFTAAALSQQAFAFLGALLAVGVVLGLAGRRGRIEPVTLLLVGVIVNAVNGSIFLLIHAIVRDLPGTGGPLVFLVGGIQVVSLHQGLSAAVLIALGWIILLYVSGQLNVAALHDAEAQALGVRIHRLRWIALVAASLVTAAAVSISGPIGFVGLVCPHIARLFVGSDQRRLLPAATGVGAVLLMAADALSRYLAAEDRLGTLLQVGILTGLLGGPFFLWLLFQAKRKIE
jgi:iron complex transport system permease protein